jgi:hypothetical protein
MEVRIYEDEILLIPETIEENGELNNFFNRNNPNQLKSASYSHPPAL